MKKGDILTAIDPCIMNDTKEKALDVGKKYKVLRVFFCPVDKVKTFEIKSNIGMHTFEVDAAQDFFKLFEGGEGEADAYAELLKNADILLNMFTELASETMTKWEQHQIDAVQFISYKISSNQ